MEGQVCAKRKSRRPFGQDKRRINSAEAPIQKGYKNLERGAGDREGVLCKEKASGKGQIGKEGEDERYSCERKTDDSKVLHVPAIGLVSRG